MFSTVREAWKRRDLIRELVAKDLKLRYSRPMLGFFWALILPFSTILIYFVIFSLFLKMQIEEAPFILYLMTAVFTWRFFQESLGGATTSLLDNKGLLREARFPAYFIPLAVVLANAVNFLPPLMVMIVTALFLLKGLPASILLLPVVLAIHFMVTAGLALILSILYLKWRDVKYILEAVLLFLFYLTPAFYSIALVKGTLPPLLFRLYLWNPFTGILNCYRFSIIKGFYGFISQDVGIISMVVLPFVFAVFVLGFSVFFYKQRKNDINDHLSY